MDVLSEVLRVVRLSGTIHFRAEFTHPWAILSSPPALLAARLQSSEGSVTPFHVVTEGKLPGDSGALPPIHIESGDVIVFPRGDQHVMASDPELAPVPIQDIYSQPSKEQITVVNHGGGGPAARFICGFLHADQRFDPLLKSLPAILCIRSRGETLTLETLDGTGRARADDHASAGEGVVAGVGALFDERNRDARPWKSRRAGAIGRIAFPRTAAVAVAVCGARPWRRMAGGPARSPGGSARSPCFMRSRNGRGPSKRLQRKSAFRGRRSQNASSNWSASRRSSISRAGGCIWRNICCRTARLASPRSPDASDMIPMRHSIARSGGWSARRPRHGGKPERNSLLQRSSSVSTAVVDRLDGRTGIPEALAIEPRSRGVLDSPLKRGMTTAITA